MPRVKLFDQKEVLIKAMNLFWKKGYYATSIQDLVDCLGINRASLYDTFGGKKELFKKAYLHYCTINQEEQKAFLNKYDNVREGVKELFKIAVQQSKVDEERKGCLAVNTAVEFIPNETDFSSLVEKNKEQFEEIFFNYLLTGVEKRQISREKDLVAIATLLFTFYNGLKVVTKVDFDTPIFIKSVSALLCVLD